MRVDVVTLFPELFEPLLSSGMVGRACSSGALTVSFMNPRQFGSGKHRAVDDTPYGGGAGMVMRVDCIVQALEAIDSEGAHRVLLSPQGAVFDQRKAIELAGRPALTLVCGRYEGIDDRLRHFINEEISLGDFVMSGGEVAAMAIIDACSRLLPDVLGNPASLAEESHSRATGGMLEYPQFTRPVEFRGHRVPEVLQSGHHANIAAWRQQRALERTRERRPDLAIDQEPS